MARTYVILDGLQDPQHGQALSARWAQAGLANAVDVSGQCAWLWLDRKDNPSDESADQDASLTEADITRAALIARRFGLEIRDRVGQTFVAENDLAALHGRMAYEYKSRLATALVFGLPALALHYLGPLLAGGGGQDARAMLYPWLFELLLVGWTCVAAGWPILWQGALSAGRLRMTGDLLTMLIIMIAFVPSAVGVVSMLIGQEPWFGPPMVEVEQVVVTQGGPAFHAAMVAVILAVAQRWLAHRYADRLSGKANLMLRGHQRLVAGWIMAMVLLMVFLMMPAMSSWRLGLMFGLLLPPMISLGAVNPWSGGWSMSLPVVGFAGFVLIGPGAMGRSLNGVEVEVAAGFALIMTIVFAWGWRRYPLPSVQDTSPRVG